MKRLWRKLWDDALTILGVASFSLAIGLFIAGENAAGRDYLIIGLLFYVLDRMDYFNGSVHAPFHRRFRTPRDRGGDSVSPRTHVPLSPPEDLARIMEEE